MLACRYMVLTNTEIAPLPAPILRSACPLHPSGSPNSRAPPARAPRHIPKPPPTHIPTSPPVPIRVYGVDKHRNSTPPSPSCSQHVPCTPLPRSSCSCSLAARPSPPDPPTLALLLYPVVLVVFLGAVVVLVVKSFRMACTGAVMSGNAANGHVGQSSNNNTPSQRNSRPGDLPGHFPWPQDLSRSLPGHLTQPTSTHTLHMIIF